MLAGNPTVPSRSGNARPMQITSNTTGMLAELSVFTDKDARDHCVVVVKGTFQTNARGELRLAVEQRPLVTADEHHGDPATTSVRYECDFAPEKPLTDVIVVGNAIAPGGEPVQKLSVVLEVRGRRKELVVHGHRRWVNVIGALSPSDPVAFTEMPLTFDRAWGGQDDSRGATKVEVEARNLVGVGFHPHRSSRLVAGQPVPNIEAPDDHVTSPRGRHAPAGFGCVGRAWMPRVSFAGTYDETWRQERAPFLPRDFDSRYFQCAPADQQFPHFEGGETIRCFHMAKEPMVEYVIPDGPPPIRFRFVDGEVERIGVLDTVTLEPHLGLAMLAYRASVPLRKKLTALREITVGTPPAVNQPAVDGIRGYRNGKPVFRGLAPTLRWLRQRRGGER